jgi:hypothetical protein
MLKIVKPTEETVSDFLAAQRSSTFTYQHIGGTKEYSSKVRLSLKKLINKN